MYFQVCSNSTYPQHSGERYRTNGPLVINVLGMVHLTEYLVHMPLEITIHFVYLKPLISQSEFVGPLEFEITRVACISILPENSYLNNSVYHISNNFRKLTFRERVCLFSD